MKVLLIQPPFTILRTETKKCHPPLGLAYLAGSLKDSFEVKVLDALVEGYDKNKLLSKEYLRYGLAFEDIEQKIREFSPDVVGVSCLFSSQIENVYEVFKITKRINNKIITVMGGAHPSAVPEEAIKNETIDFVIIGEGETTLKRLLQAIDTGKELSDMEGLACRIKGQVAIYPKKKYEGSLDNIAFPYWDILPLEKYYKINNPHGNPARRIPFLPVITSRGCPFRCIFCSVHNLWGNNYRKRSAENILKELEYLVHNFGVREVLFEDDNLTFDRERAKKIFQGIIKKKLDISWSTPNGVALQTLDDEVLELMKASGCYSISVGIESGDEFVLKNIIRKPVVLSKVKPVIDTAKRLGLETTAFFVVGLPGESRIHINNTFRFAEEIKTDNVNFFFATPLPGTRLLGLCREKGLIKDGLVYSGMRSDRPYFDTEFLFKAELLSMVNAEKLKLYFLLLFSNPLRFFSMAGLKLFKDPLYFFRFALKYLKNKEQSNSLSQKIKDTQAVYGFLWAKLNNGKPQRWHYNNMQETISEPIVRGKRGIDIGSGCGYDTLIMAKSNPAVKIISLEISEGAFKTRKLTCGLGNVWVVRGSALNIPISDNTLDFAYSFGVLHHTTDPERGIKEIARVIKKDSPVYLYVYEDHSENRIKYLALKLVKVLRVITTNIPPRVLYIISFLASPFIMVFFAFPHRLFRRFKATQTLSENMPFNFGTNLFSLAGDLYDRFGAPIEYRFSRQEIFNLLKRNGFVKISIARMKSTAGWVAWGHKG